MEKSIIVKREYKKIIAACEAIAPKYYNTELDAQAENCLAEMENFEETSKNILGYKLDILNGNYEILPYNLLD